MSEKPQGGGGFVSIFSFETDSESLNQFTRTIIELFYHIVV